MATASKLKNASVISKRFFALASDGIGVTNFNTPNQIASGTVLIGRGVNRVLVGATAAAAFAWTASITATGGFDPDSIAGATTARIPQGMRSVGPGIPTIIEFESPVQDFRIRNLEPGAINFTVEGHVISGPE